MGEWGNSSMYSQCWPSGSFIPMDSTLRCLGGWTGSRVGLDVGAIENSRPLLGMEFLTFATILTTVCYVPQMKGLYSELCSYPVLKLIFINTQPRV